MAMHPHMQLFAAMVPDLPEGVEIAKIGRAGQDDFELIEGKLFKGPRSSSQVIVRPAPGYEFVYNILNNGYSVVKQGSMPDPKQHELVFDSGSGFKVVKKDSATDTSKADSSDDPAS